MKIALCIPILERPAIEFFDSLLGLREYTLEQRPDIRVTRHIVGRCMRIEEAREDIADGALESGADWLLWLDDDHSFPADALLRLLAHDLPFIGANCRKRIPGRVVSTARRRAITKLVGISPRTEGLERVDLIGFGVTLIKAEVFRKLPRPWFKWGPLAEDGYFCEQAIKAGYQPHVDHALSMEVGHIAETVLTFPR